MTGHQVIARRFRRSGATYERSALIQERMAERLLDDLQRATARDSFARVLELGCGGGLLTRKLQSRIACEKWFLNDLYRTAQPLPEAEFLLGPVEEIRFPDALELVIANAVLQWVRDWTALFEKVATALAPGGIFAFSSFGPENLREIRELTGVGLDYPAAPELAAGLERRFELLAAHEERVELSFASPAAVLAHLKATGVTATGAGRRWSRARLCAFEQRYCEQYGTASGEVVLTYHPLHFVAKLRAEVRDSAGKCCRR